MARALLLVALLASSLFLVAFALRASDEALGRCSKIGMSSGCSGCENPDSGCEWCAKFENNAFDDFTHACAPKGHCNDIVQPQGRSWEYMSRGEVCKGDPKKAVKILSLSPYDYKFNLGRQELQNGFFDSHYCEFPSEPHVVDRFSNFLGASDPILGCHLINSNLLVGARGQIDAVLRTSRGPSFKGLTPKDKACLSLFQSAACTTRCPQYGLPLRFGELCYEFCDRILNHCEEDLLIFLENNVGVLSRVTCKAKGDTDCVNPPMIPASGRFEFDECLFGPGERCKTSNCIVEPINGPFIIPPGYGQAPTKQRDVTATAASQASPALCCWPEGEAFSDGDAVFTQEFRIVEKGSPDGLSCEAAVENWMINEYGHRSSDLGICLEGCSQCHDTDDDGEDDVCWNYFSLLASDPLSESCDSILCDCPVFYPECGTFMGGKRGF